jgi:hypothetical protein
MGALNREWHEGHVMPKNPTPDQRLEWHIEHLKHCACRTDLPKSVLKTMEERGIPVPENAKVPSR